MVRATVSNTQNRQREGVAVAHHFMVVRKRSVAGRGWARTSFIPVPDVPSGIPK
jgi:hypothetical protein